ncbi:MAG: hypothetical protein HY319_23750 [Armatimonadetes bacterium]|nr:hypothetical protein [Armatimonadota bacterium]
MASWRDYWERVRDGARALKERVQDFLIEHETTIRKYRLFLVAVPLLLLGFWIGGQVAREVRQEELAVSGDAVALGEREAMVPPSSVVLDEGEALVTPPYAPLDEGEIVTEPGAPARPEPVQNLQPAAQQAPASQARSHPHPAALETPPAPPPPAPLAHGGEPESWAPEEGAEAHTAVVEFYKAVGQRDFSRAYDRLSPQWQQELSLGAFAGGYLGTEQVVCRVDNVSLLPGRRVRVDVRLDVLESGSRAEYLASYLVVQTPTGWRLDRGLQYRT